MQRKITILLLALTLLSACGPGTITGHYVYNGNYRNQQFNNVSSCPPTIEADGATWMLTGCYR